MRALTTAILVLNGHIPGNRLLQCRRCLRADHGGAAALGVARMGEQANYRPPGRQAARGQVSLDALETALGTARGHEPHGGDAHVRPPGAGAPRPGTNPGPPWPAVVATTVGLWLRRRTGALGGLFRRHRVAALIVLAATALVASGLAVSIAKQTSAARAAGEKAARAGVPPGPVSRSPGAAATWVARQVSRDAVVGCDPSMCRSLQAHGFPAGSLLALLPG